MGKGKDHDRVVLDVGGTKFVTTKKTLSAWSSAFDFSTEDTIVLDADPDAFAVLLSFMRNGSIESEKVTGAVLKQAIQFQIEGFLSFVKNLDRVVLNIRGTHIEVSKKLLMESSIFFRNKFHNDWAMETTPFLDQDPADFLIILKFMTRGRIEQSQLSLEVLEVAEYLGIERLLDAIKVQMCWMGTDERSIDKFHEEYGTISNAITTCGGKVTHNPSTNLEYASVYLHRRTPASKTSIRLPFRACVYGSVSAELLRMGDTINLLNGMGKGGFALASPNLQTSWRNDKNEDDVAGLGRILAHLVFVRERDARRRRNSVQSRIIQDDTHKIQPKEFAALLRPAQELQSGNTVKLVIPSSDSAPAYWAGTFLRDPPDPGFHGALAWLNRHGFFHQEPILAEAFSSALVEMEAEDEGSWASVLVFSKPIRDMSDSLSPTDSGSLMESTISTSVSLDVG